MKFKTVTKQDIPILLQLIKELAQYEHLLNDLSIHFYQKQGAIAMYKCLNKSTQKCACKNPHLPRKTDSFLIQSSS